MQGEKILNGMREKNNSLKDPTEDLKRTSACVSFIVTQHLTERCCGRHKLPNREKKTLERMQSERSLDDLFKD